MSNAAMMLARKNYAVATSHLRKVTATKAAETVGISDTTLGDFVNKGGLQRACDIIAAVGCKVVGAGDLTYTPEQLSALATMARMGLDALPTEAPKNEVLDSAPGELL